MPPHTWQLSWQQTFSVSLHSLPRADVTVGDADGDGVGLKPGSVHGGVSMAQFLFCGWMFSAQQCVARVLLKEPSSLRAQFFSPQCLHKLSQQIPATIWHNFTGFAMEIIGDFDGDRVGSRIGTVTSTGYEEPSSVSWSVLWYFGVVDGVSDTMTSCVFKISGLGLADLEAVGVAVEDGVELLEGVGVGEGLFDGVFDEVGLGDFEGVFDDVGDGLCEGVLDGVCDGVLDGVLDDVGVGECDGDEDILGYGVRDCDAEGDSLFDGEEDTLVVGVGE